MEKHLDDLKHIFRQWSGEEGIEIVPLPAPESERQYFRMNGNQCKAIGVYSPNRKENQAFLSFTGLFHSNGLHVPELFASDPEKCIYLLQDLGSTSLLDKLENQTGDLGPEHEIRTIYKKVIDELIKFQVVVGNKIDFSLCYPSGEFSERSIRWNLNYFKYYFLKLLKVPYNEYELENDFDTLTSYILQSGNPYFMYRDFQARNILINDNIPYFIDYQGGCKGPLQFDLASLLFQVKADLPFDFREEMLNYYLSVLSDHVRVDKVDFTERYYGFVLLRLLQVMGAYGYHGYFERRQHFLKSIPYAVKNAKWLLDNVRFDFPVPALLTCLKEISSAHIEFQKNLTNDQLTIAINSFAYKNGPPPDYSGNGGGFIFDCRSLPNPARYDHYLPFTGKESLVNTFLQREPIVSNFMQSVFKLVEQAIAEYQRKKFNSLQVNFGSTEGQHRSVYCAEKLAIYIEEKYSLNIVIKHTEQEKKRI